MGKFCTQCGKALKPEAKFCQNCGAKLYNEKQENIQQQQPVESSSQQEQFQQPTQTVQQQTTTVQTSATSPLWLQNQYLIRKKVLTVGNKYWIEDTGGNIIGFCKQKILKLKEDIRIYTDESMSYELFRIQQQQILDVVGNFAVIDSANNVIIGYVQRDVWSVVGRDTWDIQNAYKQSIGKITEKSLGRALTRKYMPMGGLVPEKMQVELNGQVVAELNQDFKVIGDIWNLICYSVPADFDRRVLIACMILMGTIERDRKGSFE
jgi:uncharacterized protein YxjI